MNTIDTTGNRVAGLVLAAGKSSRMGSPKMDLPWGNTSILGAVISAMSAGGLGTVNIVINPLRKPANPDNLPDIKINWIENQEAEVEDMLVSIQTGLRAMPDTIHYAMICPGDQPTIAAATVKALLDVVTRHTPVLIFPSYHMRRGHPWMVHRSLWQEILQLNKTDNVRTVLHTYENDIFYVKIDSDPPPDIDTPEEYQQLISQKR